jgi:acetylornithine deacetylase/succinyl-diaminopimelate desuccinylase-like protein
MKSVLNALLCVGCLCGPALAPAASVKEQVTHYRMTHEAAILGQLDELTRIKSIAADPAGIAATAHRLQDLLKERGFEAQLLSEAGAPPLIFGELKTPGARHTVVFYAHYDGQPVTPAQWSSDPFSPVMRTGPLGSGEHEVDWKAAGLHFDPQWRFYGRAISDDKASIVAFLSAFDALKAAGRRPSANIKVVWDGEEERGSPHLEKTLNEHQASFTGDL